MAALEDLPAELVMRVLYYTNPSDLESFSQINHRWYSLASKRLRLHRELRLKFKTLHDGFLWRDVLVNLLRDPWIGHYVTTLSMNQKVRRRKRLLSGSAVYFDSYENSNDGEFVRTAIGEHPAFSSSLLKTSLEQINGQDEAPRMAFLLTLLPNVRYFTMNAPSTWKGLKIVENIATWITRLRQQEPSKIGGMSNKLEYMEFRGFYHGGPCRANISFLSPFMAMPRVRTLKLFQIGGSKFTPGPNIPLSGLTSLILERSPLEPRILSALLARTPWLKRFVCGNYVQGRFSDSDIYLDALKSNVSESIQLLGLASPYNIIDPKHSNPYFFEFNAFPNLRVLYISLYQLISMKNLDIPDEKWPALKTLAVNGVPSSASAITAIRELAAHTRCEQLYTELASEYLGLDLKMIIERELLKEACTEMGVTLTFGLVDFRAVVKGMNEKWTEYT
ncbi:MAG: hypothetical protein Q9195_003552 [Heterodermia aff. obscurata]